MNTANYLGFNDWRLPATLVPDNGCTNLDGSLRTDSGGWNCTGSEMGHLYYDEFGGMPQGSTNNLIVNNPDELAKFSDIPSGDFWSGTELDEDQAFTFRFWGLNGGTQINSGKPTLGYGWAVRDGGVSSVPVPAAVWLFGSGLLGLVGLARRKKA